jgi:uncharacterized membrane protein YphA (DoxX/SURF4 family)
MWFTGLLALVGAALLLAGFLTPLAAAVLAAGAAGAGFPFLPACTTAIFDSKTSFIFGFTMLVAVIGLGPGAFSVDARIFGRREIIIPPPVSSLQE